MTTNLPFNSLSNRLVRPCDDQFATLMKDDQAVVRMIGPRRTGKTSLVASYCRAIRTPAVTVSLHPAPQSSPAVLLESCLLAAIQTLETEAPKLHRAFKQIAPESVKSRLTISANLPIPGLPDPLAVGGSASYEQEPILPTNVPLDVETAALGRVVPLLRSLALAADKTKCRPVVFFDEIQELLLSDSPGKALGMAAVWAIRNEVQHHTSCRYVFAGSNQRLFATLQSGKAAPLLHFGHAIAIPPLTVEEADKWALPFFKKAQVHVRSFEPLCRLLCGKIGELTDVLAYLWVHTNPNDFLDEKEQLAALRHVVLDRTSPEADDMLRQLTPSQATILQWMLTHPAQSPYARAACATGHRVPVGTVKTSVHALIEKGFIEDFDGALLCATPIRILGALR